MARPMKEGLDYFPLDVFSGKKIKRLKSCCGNDGICVYLFLLTRIYWKKGYYAPWTRTCCSMCPMS